MANNDESYMSMSDLRERQRANRAKRQKEAAAGPDDSSLYNFNMSTSFIANTPKRSNSILLPSKSAILKRLQSHNGTSNVSFLAGQMDGGSVSNIGFNRSNSFIASRALNKSLGAPNRSMLHREASFAEDLDQHFGPDDCNFNILDDTLLSIGEPDLKPEQNPFKRARSGGLAPPIKPLQPSHQLYRSVSLNPFDMLYKIPLGKDRDYLETIHIIPPLGNLELDPKMITTLRRELSALKAIDQPFSDLCLESSESDPESAPSLCVDSDDDFHALQVEETKQALPIKKSINKKDTAPKKSLEEKVGEFLSAYRPLSKSLGDKFNISSQVPLDLSIKEGCTLMSQSPLDFLLPTGNAELEALSHYSSKCHGFSSWSSHAKLNLFQVLTTHHYPTTTRPKFLATKTSELLSLSKTRHSNSTPDQTELLKIFADTEAEWQDTFSSLFAGCMQNHVPYFYYINSEFSVIMISPTTSQDITNAHQAYGLYTDPNPSAFLHGATPGLTKLLRSKNVSFTVSNLTHTNRQKPPPKGLSKDQVKTYEKAVKPAKGSQLLFEGHNQVQSLFKFLLDWKNPKQDLRCQGSPSLIAATPFKRSQARIPKISHRESKATDPHFIEGSAQEASIFELKIDGIILPSALNLTIQILLEKQDLAFAETPDAFQFSESSPKDDNNPPRNDFQLKAFLKPHVNTLGLAGRWILPPASLSYTEAPNLFDQVTPIPLPGPKDFVLTPSHLSTFLYASTRFFW